MGKHGLHRTCINGDGRKPTRKGLCHRCYNRKWKQGQVEAPSPPIVASHDLDAPEPYIKPTLRWEDLFRA